MNLIHYIPQAAGCADLQASGVMPTALDGTEPQASVRSHGVGGIDAARAGVWECTPGRWRRAIPGAEVMHFLAGDCTFTPDGGEPLRIRAGDTVIFPIDTHGTWEVRQTVRKVFVAIEKP